MTASGQLLGKHSPILTPASASSTPNSMTEYLSAESSMQS